ncbi:MAG: cytochrome c oxidase assembly protein [Alphaproteobacteria bacterium]
MAGRGRRNSATLFVLAGVAVGMVGLSFAAVPLYRLFCQVTGFGGTTQVAEETPARVDDRIVTVRFNADTAAGLPWRFRPEQREIRVHLGEVALAYFTAENLSDHTIVGNATFNVTPYKAGPYFSKIACFCFDEQTLAPGQVAEMPVTFFVDPEMADDPKLKEVTTITLSYTFFAARDSAPALTSGDDLKSTTDSKGT